MMKKVLGFFILILSMSCAMYILWDVHLSTFLPKKDISQINQNPKELPFLNKETVNFLHFFDPSCLNSRINIDHLPLATREHSGKAEFFLIIVGSDKIDPELIPPNFKVIEDPSGEIARYCGISTIPSALVYKEGRGSFFANYNNKNGLCGASDIKYSGPAIALRFMVEHDKFPVLPPLQKIQVGCPISEIRL